MRIRRAATAAVLCAVGLTGLAPAAATAEESRHSGSVSESAKLDPDSDTSGQMVWERFGSAGDIPADRIGETFSAKRLDAARAANAQPNTVTPQSSTSHPTAEREKHLARALGQRYIADGSETRSEQLGKFRSDAVGTTANGIIEFDKCEADPAGQAQDKNSPGHVIDHFNFCRWGYNQVTKLDGKGRIEGYVRFKEIEVGEGAKGTRTGRIHIKTKDVDGFGIYSEFSGTRMKIQPSLKGDINHLGECGNNNLVDFGGGKDSFTRELSGWEDQYIYYEITSDETKADQSRVDKVSYCQFETHYKVLSAKGNTPWSYVSPTGGMRFDSATYMGSDIQYGHKGAIFNRVTPVFSYDRADASVESVAEHIFDALYAPQLTYPQKNDKDIPGNIWNGEWQPLHRNVKTGTWGTFSPDSDAIAAANERAKDSACAGLTRPADHDCDEFPFASTKEGAGVGDGNFSVRMVPATENRSAGGKLSAWYSKDRILDGDPYGIFVN
ncbi:hypothetical protein G3I31_07335 [Streptomyces sp. SID9913]|uniref:Deoxyribonuclease NucA/NucB domain-containing protein n=2 Tax=unclassified Streptomyces TaxID=2593676 RepID=A0A6G3QTW6_9ACTN|nr:MULTISPECIES: NucA/NucB deoxyribonuclease domain-containing protein [unclassified Streptomyces]NEA86664.1 hypothetical protein [Streptomyces sp. SID14436]NEC81061.1 hypothetical protein [Streptomyces sp. SID7958]NED17959.1 hypothetical protein [Streptomyces sp. SID9913]